MLWVGYYRETKQGICVHLKAHPSRMVCGVGSLRLWVKTFPHLKSVRSNPTLSFPKKGILAPNFNPVGYDNEVRKDSKRSELGGRRSHITGRANMVGHGWLQPYLGNGLVSPTPCNHPRQHRMSIMKPRKEGWFILRDRRDQNSKAQKHVWGCNVEYIVVMNSIATDDIQKAWDGVDIVQEFADVFLDNFGMPPSREMEFIIELLSRSSHSLRHHTGWFQRN